MAEAVKTKSMVGTSVEDQLKDRIKSLEEQIKNLKEEYSTQETTLQNENNNLHRQLSMMDEELKLAQKETKLWREAPRWLLKYTVTYQSGAINHLMHKVKMFYTWQDAFTFQAEYNFQPDMKNQTLIDYTIEKAIQGYTPEQIKTYQNKLSANK